MSVIRFERETQRDAAKRVFKRRMEIYKSPEFTTLGVDPVKLNNVEAELFRLDEQVLIDMRTGEALKPLEMGRAVVLFERVRIVLPPKKEKLKFKPSIYSHR